MDVTLSGSEPEVRQLADFLSAFNRESDRGAALVAASMLDDRLQDILLNFFLDARTSNDLLSGFNAPLGTFAARAAAARALGLIQANEFDEITLFRRIRNVFGHGWGSLSFSADPIRALAMKLPWCGPRELEGQSGDARSRFNFAIAALLLDLMWRTKLVARERRTARQWSNTNRVIPLR